jgi:hypothetical protein
MFYPAKIFFTSKLPHMPGGYMPGARSTMPGAGNNLRRINGRWNARGANDGEFYGWVGG